MSASEQFNDLSIELTKKLDNDEKKKNGIFFTPKNTVIKISEFIYKYCQKEGIRIKRILEPSCGSGQFFENIDILKLGNNVDIVGIEKHQEIRKKIKKKKFFQKITYPRTTDFLEYNPEEKFSLVIGNPPYFVMKKNDVDEPYYKYFDGRPNIYILFIIHSLTFLADKGILAFVLPKNFLNCIYYNKLRKHINNKYRVLNIMDFSEDNYIETQQPTIGLIIQKNEPTKNDFTMNINDFTIFNTKEAIKELNGLVEGTTTLDEMGFSVSVGNVVWNQVKDLLTDEEIEEIDGKKQTRTRLIYSGDIVNNKLTMVSYKNKDKKRFIKKEGDDNMLLIINRGYGKGKYKFNYCLINENKKEKITYLIENHLIRIKYKTDNRKELKKQYNIVMKSFKDERTNKFIDRYFGNNAINTTELQYILPIFT